VVVALLANTAPVAFGGVGVPIVALAGVTGLDLMQLSAMVGRQLPFLSLILPAYLALLVAGPAGLRRTWPAALVAGTSFAIALFLVSNLWGPYATDVLSAIFSIVVLSVFLRFWKMSAPDMVVSAVPADTERSQGPAAARFPLPVFAWLPWAVLS